MTTTTVRACAVDGCAEPWAHRKWCEGHYRRWLDHGDPLAGRKSPSPGRCSVDGCTRTSKARGWCKLHYYRWKRTGSVGDVAPGLTPCQMPGALSPFWRNSQLTYSGAHSRVRTIRGAASDYACVGCDRPASHWSYNHDDPDAMVEPIEEGGKPYSADPARYRPRCSRCHSHFDAQMRASR